MTATLQVEDGKSKSRELAPSWVKRFQERLEELDWMLFTDLHLHFICFQTDQE